MNQESPKKPESAPETRGEVITKERMLEILKQEEINFELTEDGKVRYKTRPNSDVLLWDFFRPNVREDDFIAEVQRLKKRYPDMVRKPIIVKEDFWEE